MEHTESIIQTEGLSIYKEPKVNGDLNIRFYRPTHDSYGRALLNAPVHASIDGGMGVIVTELQDILADGLKKFEVKEDLKK